MDYHSSWDWLFTVMRYSIYCVCLDVHWVKLKFQILRSPGPLYFNHSSLYISAIKKCHWIPYILLHLLVLYSLFLYTNIFATVVFKVICLSILESVLEHCFVIIYHNIMTSLPRTNEWTLVHVHALLCFIIIPCDVNYIILLLCQGAGLVLSLEQSVTKEVRPMFRV